MVFLIISNPTLDPTLVYGNPTLLQKKTIKV